MAVSDTLDELRSHFKSCSIVAFADLSVGMILAKSSDSLIMQERWDGLCVMANDVLRGPSTRGVLECLEVGEGTTLSRAAVVDLRERNIFMTSPTAPDLVLCAVGCANFGISDFYAAATPILEKLVQHD